MQYITGLQYTGMFYPDIVLFFTIAGSQKSHPMLRWRIRTGMLSD